MLRVSSTGANVERGNTYSRTNGLSVTRNLAAGQVLAAPSLCYVTQTRSALVPMNDKMCTFESNVNVRISGKL